MLMTILKDDVLNYDCDVWFLKERRKKKAQRSQIAIVFFSVYFINVFIKWNASGAKSRAGRFV